MNIVQNLFNRQHGLSKVINYDFALRRLCVAKEDSWRGIVPSNFSSDFNPEPPIFSAKFANCNGYRHILAIANEDGKIALQDTTQRNFDGEEKSLNAPQCHYNAVFDLEWSPGQMKFVSASGDHTARLWQVDGSDIRSDRVFMGHNRSVKTAAFRRDDSSVFATGGRDGAIIIWDTRANLNVDSTPRADNCIYSGHVGGPGTPVSQKKRTRTPKVSSTTSSSITGLAFQDTYTLVSCGAGDGVIKVWDLRRNYTSYKREPLPKYSLPYAGCSTFRGFTNLIIDEPGARLYANCMDNTIYCYNLFSYDPKPVACYKGLLNSTFYIKSCLSPDGKYLVSGSSDEKAYIWNIDYPDEPLVALSGHTVEVTCVAWGSTHDQPLVTCSDDARHKIWRIGPSEITEEDRVEKYCGTAEFVRKFSAKPINKVKKMKLSDLDVTPRSLKRFVEQNEKTPGTIEKVSNKRSFLDMMADNASANEGSEERDIKRLKTIESKGRRLFSPGPSSSMVSNCSGNAQIARCLNIQLSSIPEEAPSTSSVNSSLLQSSPLSRYQEIDFNNQENTSEGGTLCSSTIKSVHGIMPLTERSLEDNQNPNYNSSPTQVSPSITSMTQQTSLSSVIFSPTSNLPNYVIDGDAPHLGIMSPKRKAKDKVDWLTKIRKQKLMSCRGSTLTEKMNDERAEGHAGSTTVSSPRVQSLRNSEGSPRVSPKRRSSHSSCNAHHHIHASSPKTPTSSRRNSENTILRFFTVQRQESITTNSTPNDVFSKNITSNHEISHLSSNQSEGQNNPSDSAASSYTHTNVSPSSQPSSSSVFLLSQNQPTCGAYD